MIPKYSRHQLEQFIVQENIVLRECVDLLERRIPLSDWSHDVRIAFLLAIQPGEGQEAYKAFNLVRHLRVNGLLYDEAIPHPPTSLQRRCAERIRADLSRLVRLGAGRYLHR